MVLKNHNVVVLDYGVGRIDTAVTGVELLEKQLSDGASDRPYALIKQGIK